jgi:N-acetylglucosamine-6-phosphate deacetylase
MAPLRLPDGTLSGKAPHWDYWSVQNWMNWGFGDLEQAIAMATITPRIAIQAILIITPRKVGYIAGPGLNRELGSKLFCRVSMPY